MSWITKKMKKGGQIRAWPENKHEHHYSPYWKFECETNNIVTFNRMHSSTLIYSQTHLFPLTCIHPLLCFLMFEAIALGALTRSVPRASRGGFSSLLDLSPWVVFSIHSFYTVAGGFGWGFFVGKITCLLPLWLMLINHTSTEVWNCFQRFLFYSEVLQYILFVCRSTRGLLDSWEF